MRDKTNSFSHEDNPSNKKNPEGSRMGNIADAFPKMPGWKKEEDKEVPDATLLFMTMCVTMTAENEMPIVAPYTGEVPKDIMSIARIGGAIDPRYKIRSISVH